MASVNLIPGTSALVLYRRMAVLAIACLCAVVISMVFWVLYFAGAEWVLVPATVLFIVGLVSLALVRNFGFNVAEKRLSLEVGAGYSTMWQRHPSVDWVDPRTGTVLLAAGSGRRGRKEIREIVRSAARG